MHLVDTDLIIDSLRNVQSSIDAIDTEASNGLFVSLVSVGELYDGAYGSPDPDHRLALIQSAIRGFHRLGLSEEIMDVFARQRFELRRRGMLIPDLDLLIASTAIAHKLTLMTRNTRHFSRITGLVLYQWDQPDSGG